MSSDPFVDHKHRDFEVLRKSRRRNMLWIGLFFLITLGVLSIFYGLLGGNEPGLSSVSRNKLISADVNWARELLDQEQRYRVWLEDHGTGFEVRVYNSLSELLLRGAVLIADYQGNTQETSLLTRSYVALDFAALRIAFILLACWRIWFLATLAMVGWTYVKFGAYQADDLLGQTGNGRVFYSGIRGALENLNQKGVPELQVTGLVCPASVTEQEARASSLGKFLEREGIDTETNIALAAIILGNANYPAFIPKSEDQEKFDLCFAGGSLPEASLIFLTRALELQKHYSVSEESDPRDQSPFSGKIGAGLEKVNLEEYGYLLKQTFHRALTHRMRALVGRLDPARVATVILAYQAGKSLAYDNHAGMWVRASAFSQLSARAVLHSVPAFAKEYDAESRRVIRGALIYGSRSSVYGPVRFDKNMADESRALRQWVEILMACPHELQQVGDEVELFGFVSTVHASWRRTIFDHLQGLRPEVRQRIFATHSSLLLLPVEIVVKAMRGLVSRAELERIGELIEAVSQQQVLRRASLALGNESVKSSVPAYERIFAPLSLEEIERFCAEHGLKEDIVRDWSSFRVVLNAYGWLARRVGDYSVPESSLIFTIMKPIQPDARANELGLIGAKGMIALRGSRFEEQWGSRWFELFQQVRSSNMANNTALYEKLMAGIEDSIDDGYEGAAA